jgi:hypothetical protein
MDPVILNTILAIWPVVLAGALFLAFTFGYIRVAPGPRRWHILLALSNVGVLAYAVLFPAPNNDAKFVGLVLYLLLVTAFSLVLLARPRAHAQIPAPVMSAGMEDSVLVIHGHAQVLQGAGVVFDTRQSAQTAEAVVRRTPPTGE